MLSSLFSKPYSRLYIVGDNAGWVIDQESEALARSARKLGIKAFNIKRAYFNLPQAVHYSSQFSLNESSIYRSRHRISVDYFHGKPEQGENFKKCFESLKANHSRIARVRVSTMEMESLIRSSGIDPEKVVRIPIGFDEELFRQSDVAHKAEARAKLGIPMDAIVIGSFQKDGMGWSEGNDPKLIKGPDAFLEVIGRLKPEIPGLFVLLSGPARGYMKRGLDRIGIPYKHLYLKDASVIRELYDALDLYLITSREEGGPKACLEAMAKGVPLVTTAVGQCKDLAEDRRNAMVAPIDDIERIYRGALELLTDRSLRETVIRNGLLTASENSYEAQLPKWQGYFKALIN
jgi:glycosyltransferase involved in cell wall biosynthesis